MAFPAALWGRLCSIIVQNIMILAWTVLEKFHPKRSEVVFSAVFPYNFRPEVVSGVISVWMSLYDLVIQGQIVFEISWGADFLSNKRTNMGEAYPNTAKRMLTIKICIRSMEVAILLSMVDFSFASLGIFCWLSTKARNASWAKFLC